MVDVEADGPIPGEYSMISFGVVIVEPSLTRTFTAKLRPISERWIKEALAVSGFTREETEAFDDAASTMHSFRDWINSETKGRSVFVSDNNGFDWQFINWYFWKFVGENPFGHSSMNLGSLYKGLEGDCFKNFKHLRITKHTHDPLDDAKGNAEAMLAMIEQHGLKIKV
jgi:DNA polymerase III epsilon subunit-like protein